MTAATSTWVTPNGFRASTISLASRLHAKNRLLEGERPVDLLAADRFDEVRGAAESFINGAYV